MNNKEPGLIPKSSLSCWRMHDRNIVTERDDLNSYLLKKVWTFHSGREWLKMKTDLSIFLRNFLIYNTKMCNSCYKKIQCPCYYTGPFTCWLHLIKKSRDRNSFFIIKCVSPIRSCFLTSSKKAVRVRGWCTWISCEQIQYSRSRRDKRKLQLP